MKLYIAALRYAIFLVSKLWCGPPFYVHISVRIELVPPTPNYECERPLFRAPFPTEYKHYPPSFSFTCVRA